MPTYQYKCKACGHEFEEFQSMSDDPLVKCPSCGKKKLVRLITGAGLVFKGSGFYLTDYKKKGASPPDSPKEKSPPGDAPSEKKGEKSRGKSSAPGGKSGGGSAAPPKGDTA